MKTAFIKTRSYLMLFMTALIWGATFAAQKSAMTYMGPYMFNGIRCLIGAFALFVTGYYLKSSEKYSPKSRKNLLEGGLILGVLLFIASNVQQVGIVYTTAGKAGFISSLYTVIVPILAVIRGEKIKPKVWFAVILAVLGLYFLCINGAFAIGKGDLLVLFCAFFFALHIFFIGKYSKKTDSIKLSAMQFLVAGILTVITGLIFEDISLDAIVKCKFEFFVAGILSCAIAYTFQISAQKFTKSYIASLILSLESVVAAIFGFLFLNETMTIKEITGCILMFGAIFVVIYNKKMFNFILQKPNN